MTKEVKTPDTDLSPHKESVKRWNVVGILIYSSIFIGIILYSFRILQKNLSIKIMWIIIFSTMIFFLGHISYCLGGTTKAILTNKLKRYDLSLLQLISWTLLIISTLFTSVIYNIRLEEINPLQISIQDEILFLIGIDFTVAIGTPLINSSKDSNKNEILVGNLTRKDAKFGELFLGDMDSNNSNIDIGKIQVFLISVLLIFVYSIQCYNLFSEANTKITSLPTFDASMITLLTISNFAYLGKKAIPNKTAEEKQNVVTRTLNVRDIQSYELDEIEEKYEYFKKFLTQNNSIKGDNGNE